MKIIKRILRYIPGKLKLFIKRILPSYKVNKKRIENIIFSAYPALNGNSETLFLRPELRKPILRLVHIGLHKNGNAGDTLLFPAVRALLQKYLAPIEFTLINLHDAVTQETINIINTHDGVIIGGGGLFLKDTNYNQLSGWQWACPLDMLEKIKIPIVVFSVGYNRFRGQEEFDAIFKENINLLLEKSSFFSLRNTGSIGEIKKYVNPSYHDKLLFQPCPTTLLSRYYPYEKPFNRNGKVLALNIPFDRNNLRYCGQESGIFKSIAEALQEIEGKGWKVILYNHLVKDGKAEIWLRKYGVSPPHLNLNILAPDEIIRWYNYANAVIGGRGHAQMIPFGLNIPIFSLISHNKMGYFLEDIKHPEWGEEIASPLLKDKIINFVNSIENDSFNLYLTEAQNSLWQVTMNNMEKLKRVFG